VITALGCIPLPYHRDIRLPSPHETRPFLPFTTPFDAAPATTLDFPVRGGHPKFPPSWPESSHWFPLSAIDHAPEDLRLAVVVNPVSMYSGVCRRLPIRTDDSPLHMGASHNRAPFSSLADAIVSGSPPTPVTFCLPPSVPP